MKNIKLIITSTILFISTHGISQDVASTTASVSPALPSSSTTSTEQNLQSPIGMWKTIDDETHQPKSIVRIEDSNGKLEGFVEKTFPKPGESTDPICDKCSGEKKDKPILGMKIMWDLKKHEQDEYEGGEIMDPKNGKTYRCKIKLSKDGKTLTVRGFLGFSIFGRSQTWHRE